MNSEYSLLNIHKMVQYRNYSEMILLDDDDIYFKNPVDTNEIYKFENFLKSNTTDIITNIIQLLLNISPVGENLYNFVTKHDGVIIFDYPNWLGAIEREHGYIDSNFIINYLVDLYFKNINVILVVKNIKNIQFINIYKKVLRKIMSINRTVSIDYIMNKRIIAFECGYFLNTIAEDRDFQGVSGGIDDFLVWILTIGLFNLCLQHKKKILVFTNDKQNLIHDDKTLISDIFPSQESVNTYNYNREENYKIIDFIPTIKTFEFIDGELVHKINTDLNIFINQFIKIINPYYSDVRNPFTSQFVKLDIGNLEKNGIYPIAFDSESCLKDSMGYYEENLDTRLLIMYYLKTLQPLIFSVADSIDPKCLTVPFDIFLRNRRLNCTKYLEKQYTNTIKVKRPELVNVGDVYKNIPENTLLTPRKKYIALINFLTSILYQINENIISGIFFQNVDDLSYKLLDPIFEKILILLKTELTHLIENSREISLVSNYYEIKGFLRPYFARTDLSNLTNFKIRRWYYIENYPLLEESYIDLQNRIFEAKIRIKSLFPIISNELKTSRYKTESFGRLEIDKLENNQLLSDIFNNTYGNKINKIFFEVNNNEMNNLIRRRCKILGINTNSIDLRNELRNEFESKNFETTPYGDFMTDRLEKNIIYGLNTIENHYIKKIQIYREIKFRKIESEAIDSLAIDNLYDYNEILLDDSHVNKIKSLLDTYEPPNQLSRDRIDKLNDMIFNSKKEQILLEIKDDIFEDVTNYGSLVIDKVGYDFLNYYKNNTNLVSEIIKRKIYREIKTLQFHKATDSSLLIDSMLSSEYINELKKDDKWFKVITTLLNNINYVPDDIDSETTRIKRTEKLGINPIITPSPIDIRELKYDTSQEKLWKLNSLKYFLLNEIKTNKFETVPYRVSSFDNINSIYFIDDAKFTEDEEIAIRKRQIYREVKTLQFHRNINKFLVIDLLSNDIISKLITDRKWIETITLLLKSINVPYIDKNLFIKRVNKLNIISYGYEPSLKTSEIKYEDKDTFVDVDDDDYRKYLKYKQKYIALKKKLSS